MSNGITQESMLSVLPGVLARDQGMYDLAQLVGWVTAKMGGANDAAAIYQHIDTLDEELCDLLANDLKVDWYDYDADVATKRRQLTSNWLVRQKLGTVTAVKTALQDVWPDTTVEEWFDYGGEPGYFQVLLSLNTAGTVPFNKAVRMIDVFKPVRAHIDGYPILRIRCGIIIKTKRGDEIKYHVPSSGTKPRYSTHGDKSNEHIVVETSRLSQIYHVPGTGEINAGTYPHYYTHGDKSHEDIVIESGGVSQKYHVPITGELNAGTYPQYNTHIGHYEDDVVMQTEADEAEYHVPIAGTIPHYSTHGEVTDGGMAVEANSVSVSYGIRKCGTSNKSLF